MNSAIKSVVIDFKVFTEEIFSEQKQGAFFFFLKRAMKESNYAVNNILANISFFFDSVATEII